MDFIKKEGKKIGMSTPLSFGKYKGKLLEDIPTWYLKWCVSNLDWFEKQLTPEALDFIKSLELESGGPYEDDDDDYCSDMGWGDFHDDCGDRD